MMVAPHVLTVESETGFIIPSMAEEHVGKLLNVVGSS
jgi:hypothetical protein